MKKSTISLQSKKFNEDIEALKKELAYLVDAEKRIFMRFSAATNRDFTATRLFCPQEVGGRAAEQEDV